MTGQLGWGILGTAQIARKNWRAIRDAGNATVRAVASRDLERSRRFVRDCQAEAAFDDVPLAFGSYEELLAAPGVQAVYIPLPTGLRKAWVVRAARAGRHVVCEKPCAVSAADLREMLDACREHGVQFMDGVMFMHSRRMERMRAALDDRDAIGDIRRVTTAFTYCAPPEFYADNIRARGDLEPQGCLGDLGWYCIRFTLWALGWQMPRQVSARILTVYEPPGREPLVPTGFSAELTFDRGVSAGFYCSFTANNQQWALVSGTGGYLHVDDFVLPFAGRELGFEVVRAEYLASGGEVRMLPGRRAISVSEPSHGEPGSQESLLFRTFSAQVLSGSVDPQWAEMALRTQLVMDACLESGRTGRVVDL